ncbi:MAG: DUF4442 domain-containing protein [Gemmatimonadales bacterium]|nr:MAG: DUF4442 domain-containing protein [Gemmatimonadales bacterium]
MAPSPWRANLALKLFSLRHIPLIAYCRPKIVRMDSELIEVRIRRSRRTRNHLGSLYFGALAIGADLAGGFLVFTKARERGLRVHFAFKDVQGEFLKRAEAAAHFTCRDGAQIDAMFDEALETGERVNRPASVVVTCPSIDPEDPVARFTLTLSLRASRR